MTSFLKLSRSLGMSAVWYIAWEIVAFNACGFQWPLSLSPPTRALRCKKVFVKRRKYLRGIETSVYQNFPPISTKACFICGLRD